VAHYEAVVRNADVGSSFTWHGPGDALLKYSHGRVMRGITLLSAEQRLSDGEIAGMLDTIRNRLLDLRS
jgi:hypothetical protein